MRKETTKPLQSIGRSLVFGALLGLGVAGVFGAGFFLREVVGLPGQAVVQAAEGENYALLEEVQALIDARYLRPQPDYATRQYAAIRGMLTTLGDPYTFFIDPPVAASESDGLAGTYGGVGVQIQRSEAGELLLYPFADSPALTAGIEAGDVLLSVNDQPVDLAIAPDLLDQMLRGEVREGNGVSLALRKALTGETRTVFVPFAVINIPSVLWRVLAEDNTIGYLQVTRFTNRTPDEVTAGLTELRAQGVSALILDLRSNTGGLLRESISVADAFIDAGVLVYERDAQGETAFDAQPGGLGEGLPLVTLVNDFTASGAEIVAGAIQDSGRGILIGQKTYGKGTVQQIFPLSDSSSLHITASEWFTPAHQPLDANGLEPNIAMIPDENGRDVELGEAVRSLQALSN